MKAMVLITTSVVQFFSEFYLSIYDLSHIQLKSLIFILCNIMVYQSNKHINQIFERKKLSWLRGFFSFPQKFKSVKFFKIVHQRKFMSEKFFKICYPRKSMSKNVLKLVFCQSVCSQNWKLAIDKSLYPQNNKKVLKSIIFWSDVGCSTRKL